MGLSSPSNTEHTKDRHCEILTGGIDDVDVSVLNLDTLYHIFMTNMNSLYHFYLELQENRGDDSLPTSQALIIGPSPSIANAHKQKHMTSVSTARLLLGFNALAGGVGSELSCNSHAWAPLWERAR